jgi:hypothetical protein
MKAFRGLHTLLFLSQRSSALSRHHLSLSKRTTSAATSMTATSAPWKANDPEQALEAKELGVWPLDASNAELLNEVHPREFLMSCDKPHEIYDLIAIGAGAGGLVSSRQVRILSC